MSTSDESFRFASVDRLAQGLARGAFAPQDLLDATIRDLLTLGRRYNAVAEVTAELAQEQLARLDRRLGRRTGSSVLRAIPYGVKDIFATEGIPTRWGAPPYRDQLLLYTATVINRLTAVGGLLAAKLAPVQLAGAGGYRRPADSLHGPGINPWRMTHWSGGSSSGSASLVAAGVLPYALGSETSGSVVVPAAFCGVTGLRPSWGAISRYGMMPVSWSFDKVGILARSAVDCRHVLEALAGSDPLDPTAADWHPEPWAPKRFKVGVLANDFEGSNRRESNSWRPSRCCEVRAPQSSGSPSPTTTFEASSMQFSRGRRPWPTARWHEVPSFDRSSERPERAGLRAAIRQPAAAYVQAVHDQFGADAALRAVFHQVDAVVAPTHLSEAPLITTDLARWPARRRHLGVLGAISGLPGVSVPMGPGPTGLPLGLSIIGDRFHDSHILHIAARFQELSDWHLRRPDLTLAA